MDGQYLSVQSFCVAHAQQLIRQFLFECIGMNFHLGVVAQPDEEHPALVVFAQA